MDIICIEKIQSTSSNIGKHSSNFIWLQANKMSRKTVNFSQRCRQPLVLLVRRPAALRPTFSRPLRACRLRPHSHRLSMTSSAMPMELHRQILRELFFTSSDNLNRSFCLSLYFHTVRKYKIYNLSILFNTWCRIALLQITMLDAKVPRNGRLCDHWFRICYYQCIFSFS